MTLRPFIKEVDDRFTLTEGLTNGDIHVGNTSNIATAVTMSKDGTLDNTGALTTPVSGGLFDTTLTRLETIIAAGALSVTIYQTKLDSTAGTMAVTLAAPAALGQVKSITLDVDGGDVTLLGTNILGQESATATFDTAGQALTLIAASEAGSTLKWQIVNQNVFPAALQTIRTSVRHTWAGGAATTDTATLTGVAATDVIITTINANSGVGVVVSAERSGANAVLLTTSANLANGDIISVMAIKVA